MNESTPGQAFNRDFKIDNFNSNYRTRRERKVNQHYGQKPDLLANRVGALRDNVLSSSNKNLLTRIIVHQNGESEIEGNFEHQMMAEEDTGMFDENESARFEAPLQRTPNAISRRKLKEGQNSNFETIDSDMKKQHQK